MTIKFFDLKVEYGAYKEELTAAALETLQSGHYIMGSKLKSFESAFAKYIGVKYCLGVGNGLDALKIILMGMETSGEDEIIVPAHTFIASWLPVSDLGAKLVPIEPDPSTFNINPKLIEKSINQNTKAIIAVHLYGRPVDMRALMRIGEKYNIPIIEDAAQAHGATGFGGKKCGGIGKAAAFSFYPTKNLGACGDAGAILTNDSRLYQIMSKIRNYGSSRKYIHDIQGVNSRMDELQASILSIKLKHIEDFNKKRQKIAACYSKNIQSRYVSKPKMDSHHVWHQYVIRVQKRSEFINHMKKFGVETMIHYPVPPHLTGVYKNQLNGIDLPITELLCAQVVSLPIYPGMSESDQFRVIQACNEYKQK